MRSKFLAYRSFSKYEVLKRGIMMTLYNKFIKKVTLNSPVVETTPVAWKGRLLLLEHWQREWEHPTQPEGLCYNRIRDVESDVLVVPQILEQFAFPSAFVWKGAFYIFATKKVSDVHGRSITEHIYMTRSNDLSKWTEPVPIVNHDPKELLYNESVCYDGRRFVMDYETNNPLPFTQKFACSDDLITWNKIPDAIYDGERYVGCPTIRHNGGYYYVLYTTYLYPRWRFEIALTRSKDLRLWEESPYNPIIVPDPANHVHPDCPEHGCGLKTDSSRDESYYNDIHPSSQIRFLNTEQCTAGGRECNVSDPDLVEWEGRTRIYFSGGCQHWGGLLQYAEFDGSMNDFFESCYR
jgi:alpha-L-fucosidase